MKTLYLMCGVPGSGKTHYAKNHLIPHAHYSYISRDEIRFDLVEENEDYFSKENDVFRIFVDEIVHDLKNPLNDCVIADATHINWASRKKLINAIGREIPLDNQINIIPIVIHTSLKTCLERNGQREGREVVPEKVIENMHNRFRSPSKDPFDYDGIMYVNGDRDDL